ncbi:MAG: PAS domain-containing protein [Candidatus Eremiobacteraeota bacterium]|nr:PAS domain-containing protein [Candidatus Eremiobacteraeota bacterium]
MPSAVAVYGAVDNGEDFVFRDFNKAGELIEKVDRGSILEKRVTEVFPGVKEFGVFEVFQRVWRTGQAEYFPAALYRDEHDPGTWRENRVYKLPGGEIVAIYDDITERKRAEAKILQALRE